MRFIRRPKERLYTLQEKSFVACTFQVEKFRNDGVITYQGPTFNNLILDVGMDYLGQYFYGTHPDGPGSVARFVNVGEDNTEPSKSQTGLLSFVAATNSAYSDDNGYQASGPCYKWYKRVFEFDIGSCTGNLTEVGLSHASNEDYFNRQLFRDDYGDPTTITVLEDEGLRVAVTLYFYPDIDPGETVSGSFLLNDSDTINTTRELTDDDEWIKDCRGVVASFLFTGKYCRITDSATDFSGGVQPDVFTESGYSNGDHYWEATCEYNAGTFVGDIASILLFMHKSSGIEQSLNYNEAPFMAFRLDPVISVKDTEKFTMTLRRAWARMSGDES